jgi:hypothetical protein
MRARYYSVETRRFLNADPIGFAGGLNWYAYVSNNPVNLWDPYGLFSLTGNEIIDAGLEAYSRAGQGIVNAFTGGLFDPTAGLFYDHFNKQWEDLGEASNECNDDFNTGMLGGRFAVGSLAAAGGVAAWGSAGLPTIGVGFDLTAGHAFWGVTQGGTTTMMHALGGTTTAIGASGWSLGGSGVVSLTGVPIVAPAAALAAGVPASNCVSGACGAVVRGIIGK